MPGLDGGSNAAQMKQEYASTLPGSGFGSHIARPKARKHEDRVHYIDMILKENQEQMLKQHRRAR